MENESRWWLSMATKIITNLNSFETMKFILVQHQTIVTLIMLPSSGCSFSARAVFLSSWESGLWKGGVFSVLVTKLSVCNSNTEPLKDLLGLPKTESGGEKEMEPTSSSLGDERWWVESSGKMHVYTEGIPELPVGTENKNKSNKVARIAFGKLSKSRRKRRRGKGRRKRRKKRSSFLFSISLVERYNKTFLLHEMCLTSLSQRHCRQSTTSIEHPFHTLFKNFFLLNLLGWHSLVKLYRFKCTTL